MKSLPSSSVFLIDEEKTCSSLLVHWSLYKKEKVSQTLS